MTIAIVLINSAVANAVDGQLSGEEIMQRATDGQQLYPHVYEEQTTRSEKQVVSEEMHRIKNDPELAHLVKTE